MVTVNVHDIGNDGEVVRSFNAPEQWNELNQSQLLTVANILFQELAEEERNLLLLMAVFDIKAHEISTIAGEVIIEQLFPLIKWMVTGIDLTEQKLPALRAGFRKYYGPSSYLNDLTFIEFNFAELELYYWMKDRSNLHQLWRFIACIYRPAKWKYLLYKPEGVDVRTPYDDYKLDRTARRLSKRHNIATAYAIVLWYKGCREHINKSFPAVFAATGGKEKPQPPTYFPLMRMIAKSGTYGQFKDVETMLLYNALLEIDSAIQEAERLKEQVEEMKNKRT